MTNVTKFHFDNATEMINLAKEIQVRVYWDDDFYLGENSIKYKFLWDYIEEAHESGLKGIAFINKDEVEFFN